MTSREAFENKYGYRPYQGDPVWDAWQAACAYQKQKDTEIVADWGYDPEDGLFADFVSPVCTAILNQEQ